MSALITRLKTLESLVIRCASDTSLREELGLFLESVRSDVLSRLPADDIKVTFEKFLADIKNGSIVYDDLALFVSRIFRILSALDSRIPLGLKSRNELSIIRAMILDSLSVASERFKKSFPGEPLFDMRDTKVFITGSRARGFSQDGKRTFSPGRDVDIMIVGEGIFFSEIAYMHLKGFVKDAKRAEQHGFIAGSDRRFLPPGLRSVAEQIREFFAHGDFLLGGSPEKVVVNMHIGRLSSENVQGELSFAIECV